MDPLVRLLLSALICVCLSLLVLRVLSTPLARLLHELCPGNAVGFWLRYTQVMFTLAPLMVVLLTDAMSHLTNPLDAVRLALMAAVGGLLLGLISVGRRLARFIQANHPQPHPASVDRAAPTA